MNALPEDPTPEPEPTPPEPEPTPEPEPEVEPEPEPEPQPAPTEAALSEKEIGKRIDALEREKERHAKRIGEILQEESLDLIECEACEPAIPGFHYPAGMYSEGSAQRVLYEMLGGGTEAQMRHPSRYVRCETCNGFGQVLTGAVNDIHRTKVCPDCPSGQGYHDREEARAPVYALATPKTDEPSTGAPPATPAEDFLGRPFGHPNYGLMTAYMTPEQIALDKQDGYAL